MTKSIRNSFLIIIAAILAVILLGTSSAFAASVKSGTGLVNSSDGAVLRSKGSTKGDVVAILDDNTALTIKKVVFVSKTSTAKTKKWYQVTALGKSGYIRADLVDNIKYKTVKAKTTGKVTYRSGAGTKMKSQGTIAKGKTVTVSLKATPVSSTKGSSSTWYMIKYKNKTYYACSAYFKLIDEPAVDPEPEPEPQTDEEYKNSLVKAGFPNDYAEALLTLHKKHNMWQFKPLVTNLKWGDVLSAETVGKKSQILKDGKWVVADEDEVTYYLDPRNFLTEKTVFMFEDLSYNADAQKESTVSKILTSNLTKNGFKANLFVDAGKKYDVSPVHLASRARQETGGSNGAAINGEPYSPSKDKEARTVFNPFNIGANSSVYDGLDYAYEHNWTTQKLAVEGGAAIIANGYINAGQNTLYLEKFDLIKTLADHQYMSNIVAPYSEAITTYNSYKGADAIDEPFAFIIPVYKSMPESTSLN